MLKQQVVGEITWKETLWVQALVLSSHSGISYKIFHRNSSGRFTTNNRFPKRSGTGFPTKREQDLTCADGAAQFFMQVCGFFSPSQTSHEMMMQCASRVVSHPLHVISMRCMVQFIGREVKYSGVFSSIGRIFKEEGILGFFVGLVPHILGDVIFLWCCNLLAHFINTYAVDDNFSQASVIRSYTKFVMGIAVSMLTYPFLLVGDLMAVNNCGLRAGLPPYAPAFTSWIHCWRYLRAQGQLFRGSSLLFRRAPVRAACFPID
uniref:Mitochondrial carrier 1 n=1 Tax=Apteryx owenii TaxID=8824 RepID=A0A8B9PDD9_APTOW